MKLVEAGSKTLGSERKETRYGILHAKPTGASYGLETKPEA